MKYTSIRQHMLVAACTCMAMSSAYAGPEEASRKLEEYAHYTFEEMREHTDEIFDLITSLYFDLSKDPRQSSVGSDVAEVILNRVDDFRKAYAEKSSQQS